MIWPAAQALYPTSMSPPSVEQALSALRVIRARAAGSRRAHAPVADAPAAQGADGTDRGARKLAQLRDNSNFVRDALRGMGCEVLGDEDSPVRALAAEMADLCSSALTLRRCR